MTRRHSRAEAEMEAQLRTLDPNSARYQVLAAAREFKASWVALGDKLTVVREKQSYRDWGYTNFETYCRRELRIKTETANKLTRSFAFLRDHEPNALADDSLVRELPPLDVVDLLSRARERTKIPAEQLNNIQQDVFSSEKQHTRGQVLKKLREVDPDAFRTAPRSEQTPAEGDLRKALLLAERLLSLLEIREDISVGSKEHLKKIVAELQGIAQVDMQKSA